MWGAGDSGVARGPETDVMRGCQMDEKAVSCRGCVWGCVGNVAVCGIQPRHHIFFIRDRVVVHKGLCCSPSPFCVCVRVRACTCIADARDLRALKCCVVIYMNYNFFYSTLIAIILKRVKNMM
jgi:hypothetical protein